MAVVIALPSGPTYSYPARTFSEAPLVVRFDGMKGLMNARLPWFSTVIINQSGGSMEVSAVQVLINESTRMI
jgi:hypothetical protein